MTYDMIKIKRQEKPTINGISFATDAAQEFQTYVWKLAYSIQRCGYLYGTKGEEGWLQVEVIYEPPQEGAADSFLILRNPDEEVVVQQLIQELDLHLIGMIVSHGAQSFLPDSREMLMAADLKKKAESPDFAIVVVSSNETGDSQFEAYQLSDQYLELERDLYFLPSKDPKVTNTKEDVYIAAKETRAVDNEFFLVPLPIKDHKGLLQVSFPVENRNEPQTQAHLKTIMKQPKPKFLQKMSDFHLLLYLSDSKNLGSMEGVALAQRIKDKGEHQGLEMLVSNFAGIPNKF
eukprot:TRINITY_DN1199_c0_g1_i2.p1 TRINITY_DN1199_c0_g1~~TRINITY_DN1199_c0_g1_i2.p1  ORF type:complete len:290 (+),score=46.90 TRINITY_DN1199_c0_g1_i2:418-1287(+)